MRFQYSNLWFVSRTFDQYRATVDEWTSILKIACNHDFPSVKDFAVRGLESCEVPIASRIKLYQKYEVDSLYVIPLFVKLCLRAEGPTDEETDIMGTKVALIVYRARERLRSPASSPITGPPPPISEAEAFEAISSILGYSVPISVGPGSVVFPIQRYPRMLTCISHLATSTGQNGVAVDKKTKSKTNNDKNTAPGKSFNGPESKFTKP